MSTRLTPQMEIYLTNLFITDVEDVYKLHPLLERYLTERLTRDLINQGWVVSLDEENTNNGMLHFCSLTRGEEEHNAGAETKLLALLRAGSTMWRGGESYKLEKVKQADVVRLFPSN